MVVFEGTTASNEASDENERTNYDENNRYRIATVAREINIFVVNCEHKGTTNNDSQTTELHAK